MRHRFALLSLVAVTACGADAFGPDTLAGTYDLVSLDGEPAPVVINEGPNSRLLMDATMEIFGRTWTIDQTTRMFTFSTGDTTLVSILRLAVGSWGGTAPGALTFTGSGPGTTNFSGSGTFERATGTLRLTISGSGLGSVFVFARGQ